MKFPLRSFYFEALRKIETQIKSHFNLHGKFSVFCNDLKIKLYEYLIKSTLKLWSESRISPLSRTVTFSSSFQFIVSFVKIPRESIEKFVCCQRDQADARLRKIFTISKIRTFPEHNRLEQFGKTEFFIQISTPTDADTADTNLRRKHCCFDKSED